MFSSQLKGSLQTLALGLNLNAGLIPSPTQRPEATLRAPLIKQACLVLMAFLSNLFTYHALPISPKFLSLNMVLYLDSYNYLCLLHPYQSLMEKLCKIQEMALEPHAEKDADPRAGLSPDGSGHLGWGLVSALNRTCHPRLPQQLYVSMSVNLWGSGGRRRSSAWSLPGRLVWPQLPVHWNHQRSISCQGVLLTCPTRTLSAGNCPDDVCTCISSC